MREDEIEALLKLDGAKLAVYTKGPACEVGVETYTAIIYLNTENTLRNPSGIKDFYRSSSDRWDAVYSVWWVYQKYMGGTTEEKKDIAWLYEEAEANIEIQLHTGESNGKAKS